ncbi:MAG TPA: hypothetical protein PK867_28770 [Pirellulales bacterium]|nr:hypothetical protein [Pirellulales bacterium]
MQRITEEVVDAVGIHLAADDVSPDECPPCRYGSLEEVGNLVGADPVVVVERVLFDRVSQLLADDGCRVVLMLITMNALVADHRKQVFGGVRERCMAHVVQQGC